MTTQDITGIRKGRSLRWINWRSVRFFVTVGIVSTVISHFSEGETRSIEATMTEAQLWTELEKPDGQLQRLIKQIEDSVSIGDPRPFTAATDHEAIFEQATSGVAPGDEADRIKGMFRRGTFAAWQGTPLIQESLTKQFRFLRPRTIDEHQGLLFRSADEAGSLNYHLLMMGKNADKDWCIRDIFVVGVNETVSKTLSRTYRHLVAEFARGNAYAKVVPDRAVSAAFVANLPTIAKMNQNFADNNYEAALNAYDQLPEPAQRSHKAMLMRVEAAGHTSTEMLSTAMKDWKSLYKSDETLPLKFLDYYAANGDYDAAEKLARTLDAKLGGDSYLRFRIGEILFAREVSPEGLTPTAFRGSESRRTSSSGRRGGRGKNRAEGN
ncbi:MAG: hypothetical protein R3F19_02995 [Verrucomicrobiales bacterium]